MKYKLCKHCLIPIYKDTRTGYCNAICKQLDNRKPCPVCGNTPIGYGSNKIFCSRACWHEHSKGKDCHNKGYADRLSSKRKTSTLIYYKKCKVCGDLFISKQKNGVLCSEDCRKVDSMNYGYYRNMVNHYKSVLPVYCKACGRRFVPVYRSKSHVFCSDECILSYSKKRKALDDKERSLRRYCIIKSRFVEKVSIEYLFFRDKGKCQICNKKLSLDRRGVHRLAPTIDHIIPLSKGGEHSKRNTQLACFRCNSVKSNRHGGSGDQLLLFG